MDFSQIQNLFQPRDLKIKFLYFLLNFKKISLKKVFCCTKIRKKCQLISAVCLLFSKIWCFHFLSATLKYFSKSKLNFLTKKSTDSFAETPGSINFKSMHYTSQKKLRLKFFFRKARKIH